MSDETKEELRARLLQNVRDKEYTLNLARNMRDIGSARVAAKIPKASKELEEARQKLADHDAQHGTS